MQFEYDFYELHCFFKVNNCCYYTFHKAEISFTNDDDDKNVCILFRLFLMTLLFVWEKIQSFFKKIFIKELRSGL